MFSSSFQYFNLVIGLSLFYSVFELSLILSKNSVHGFSIKFSIYFLVHSFHRCLLFNFLFVIFYDFTECNYQFCIDFVQHQNLIWSCLLKNNRRRILPHPAASIDSALPYHRFLSLSRPGTDHLEA